MDVCMHYVGVYPPTVKIYDTNELTLKCERGLDAEVVKMLNLSNDYRKIVFLLNDRNIEFHAQYGRHFKLRIPHFAHDFAFNYNNADLLIGAASSQLYRLNLESAQFLTPFDTNLDFVNVVRYSHQLNLAAIGGNDGIVDFWDLRNRKSAVIIPPKNHPAFQNFP